MSIYGWGRVVTDERHGERYIVDQYGQELDVCPQCGSEWEHEDLTEDICPWCDYNKGETT